MHLPLLSAHPSTNRRIFASPRHTGFDRWAPARPARTGELIFINIRASTPRYGKTMVAYSGKPSVGAMVWPALNRTGELGNR